MAIDPRTASTAGAVSLTSQGQSRGVPPGPPRGQRFATRLEATTYVEPAWTGAAGNGVADDTVAVQAALDEAARLGRPLRLPAGQTFLITAPLELESNQVIVGEGSASVLEFDWYDRDTSTEPDKNTYFKAGDGSTGIVGGVPNLYGLRMENFRIQGPNDGTPWGEKSANPGRAIVPTHNMAYRDSVFRNLWVDGIGLGFGGQCYNVEVSGCRVTNTGRDGIFLGGRNSNGIWCRNIRVVNNWIEQVGDDCISIHGCLTSESVPSPVDTDWATNVVVSGNTIRQQRTDTETGALGRGIFLEGVRNFTVTDNTILDTYSYGILATHLGSSTNLTCDSGAIANNVIRRAGWAQGSSTDGASGGGYANAGIAVESSTGVAVTGNVMDRPDGPGVYLLNRVFDCLVSANTVREACQRDNVHSAGGSSIAHGAIALRGGSLSERIRIVGNIVHASERRGIWVQNATDVEIFGNVVTESGQDATAGDNFRAGVYAAGVTGLRLAGNSITDGERVSVVFLNGSASTSIRMTGNTVSGNTTDAPARNDSAGNEVEEHGNSWNGEQTFGSAAPSSGTYAVGDRVWHDTPAAGGNIGWVCTTAGSPGTWKSFGTISA